MKSISHLTMNRRTGIITMGSALLLVLLVGVIASVSLGYPDPCPLQSESTKIDTKTTMYACNDTYIQIRQAGRGSVTFSVEQWKRMVKHKDRIYQALGLFEFDGVIVQVGKLKKATIGEKGEKGLSFTVDQLRQVLEWTRD